MKSKNNISIHYYIVLVFLSFILTECKPQVNPVSPALKTTNVSNVTAVFATSGGSITEDGGASITARGVCWNTDSGPTVTNSKTTDGYGTGFYTSSLTNLSPGTTYYIRAYATNSVGTSYGNEISFATPAIISTIATTSITAITTSSASSGGNISNDGGGSITARGVCWNTSSVPTISNNRTTDGTGTGSFVCSLTALNPGTKYFVRAYATNIAGTSYGSEITFSTLANLPTVTTTAVSAITTATATSGGNVTTDGGGVITARGVCWNTSTNPTIANNMTTDGSGIGAFSSLLISLVSSTTYFIRAYATNSAGTTYGNEISIKTLVPSPILTTIAPSSITSTSVLSGGNIINDGGKTFTSKGVCWSTSPNQTISEDFTVDGVGAGNFTSSITILNAGKTYYLKAYAANSAEVYYGNEILFLTPSAPIQFNLYKSYGSLSDVDGNVYKTIQIGTQLWMAENLKTTKYCDGTNIPLITDNSVWGNLLTPAYCWYNNDISSNKSIYGALYNWYSAASDKLCPTGWHVPTYMDWKTLISYVGGVSGSKMKEVSTYRWKNTGNHATNETGFTVLPNGVREKGGGYSFNGMGLWCHFWSSTEASILNAYDWKFYYDDWFVQEWNDSKQEGNAVRCIKN